MSWKRVMPMELKWPGTPAPSGTSSATTRSSWTPRERILWSPFREDRFISYGKNLAYYQVFSELKVEEITDDYIPLSSTSYALERLRVSNQHDITCASWYPKPNLDSVFAVGAANGSLYFVSIKRTITKDKGIYARVIELPREQRCNDIAWNPVRHDQLAAAFDYIKDEDTLTIWDIRVQSTESKLSSNIFYYDTQPLLSLKPSKCVKSICWLKKSPYILVCGLENTIRTFDVRSEPLKMCNEVKTKAVYGICEDPSFEFQLASYDQKKVCLWDIRNFAAPSVILNEDNVVHISWCPTRHSLLTTLTEESTKMTLYNIEKISCNSHEDIEIITHYVEPNKMTLMAYAWHPSCRYRMLVINESGCFYDFEVYDHMTLNWSANSDLVWTQGITLQITNPNDEHFPLMQGDVAKMKERVISGYGLKETEMQKNMELTKDNDYATNLWEWIGVMESARTESGAEFEAECLAGIIETLCGDGNKVIIPSESRSVSLSGPDNVVPEDSKEVSYRYYKSKDREKALWKCGWNREYGFQSADVIAGGRCHTEDEYAKEATLAFFTLDSVLGTAIFDYGALCMGENVGWKINFKDICLSVSIICSGSTDTSKEEFKKIFNDYGNPYLHALFAFFTCEDEKYEAVLNEDGMELQDRIGFAINFLPDEPLIEFLEKTFKELTKNGRLDGIIISGLTKACLPLLQNYIDITGDLQTVCLLLLHSRHESVFQEPCVNEWIYDYRELLDRWKLWTERACFDVEFYSKNPASDQTQHVYVACSYCGKSISILEPLLKKGEAPSVRTKAAISKFYNMRTRNTKTCGNCGRPLNRCALCLSVVGTEAGVFWNKEKKKFAESGKKTTPISSMLTWCQTCHHGGHHEHIMSWFREHKECPVTDCKCRCTSLDD